MIDEILEFWFGSDEELTEHRKEWWQKDEAFDAEVERRFGDTVERALAGEFDDWAETPRGTLALVIALDQFTRNIFRDTPRAFAGDPKALELTRSALDRGFDEDFGTFRRAFLYMPLEHAEEDEAQEQAIGKFEELVADAGPDTQKAAEMFLDFANKHKVVIDRFGRYPHRNEILGRETTPEEAEFLTQPNSSF